MSALEARPVEVKILDVFHRLGKFLAVSCALVLAAAQAPGQTSSTAHTPARAKPAVTQHSSTKRKKSRRRKTASYRRHGQQKIDAQRATEIQNALIREHYLTGSASGVWDAATVKAMQRYQSDNGWQDKTTPDARALIKLGLGPDQQHLLNPDSAMTSLPASPPASSSHDSSAEPGATDPPAPSDPAQKVPAKK